MQKYSLYSFQRMIVVALIGFTANVLVLANEATDNRPNILLIMADDHASHAISAYGSDLCETPNIDRLAKEGMRFINCFNVNSLCAPSRATLITGRYSHHNGFLRNGDSFDGTQVTFPKILQQAGYETALIGKWHLGTQPTGFDYYSVIPGQGQFFNCPFKDSGKPWEESTVVKGYLTDVITDKAIEWIEKRDSSKPFCLMVHHKAPHTPHHYPEEYEKLYADTDLPKPENFHTEYGKRGIVLAESRGRWSKLDHILPAHFNKEVPENLRIGTREYKEWSYQCFFKGYLRLVETLDENIGRLLDQIDKLDLYKNTVVVYTSDNGFFLGDFGLFNKMWMYEESLRLPLLVRYPDYIKASMVNDDIVSILDFAPTFLEFAKIEVPKEFQGRSICSILRGRTPADWRKSLFYHYYGQYDVPAHYGVRTADLKVIHYYNDECWELFDMKNDPREMHNLYNRPEHSDIVVHMKASLKEQRQRYENADE